MKRKPHILVIEDDAPIRTGVCDALLATGYTAIETGDGEAGLALALGEPVDLVLLDLMLPNMLGLDVLKSLRPSRPTLPVIILSALGQEADRVRGLKLGADDYVIKPFSVRELLARVEAVLRRSPARPLLDPTLTWPGGTADRETGEIRFDTGRRVTLSQREMDLLAYLARHPGRAVSRDEILLHVWQTRPEGIETRTIDMHVARLREKLGAPDPVAGLLQTVRGKGYRFCPGDHEEPRS